MTRTLLAALALLLAAAPAAAAKPGDLDRRFGNRGVATTALLDGGWRGLARPDGRILVAGGIYNPGVMRLTARGRKDRRFGRGGVARSRRSGAPFDLRLVRGEIRVGLGTVTTNEPPIAILRFGPRGQRLAPAVHEPFLPGPIFSGVLRPDGGAYVNAVGGIRAVQPDGALDAAFFGGTLERGEIPGWSVVEGLAVRSDGRVVVSARRGGEPHLLLLTPAGGLDAAFGADGAARVPFLPGLVRFLRNGDLAGAASRGRYVVRVFRLQRSGARRWAFGTRGVAGTWRGGRRYDFVEDLAEDRFGRLYALAVNRVFALTRRGAALRRFGRRGVSRRPRAPRRHSYVASALVPDRRRGLIVIGTRYRGPASHPGIHDCYDIREDFCAEEIRAAVWRIRR